VTLHQQLAALYLHLLTAYSHITLGQLQENNADTTGIWQKHMQVDHRSQFFNITTNLQGLWPKPSNNINAKVPQLS